MDKNKKAYYVSAIHEAEEIVRAADYQLGEPEVTDMIAAVFACLARHQYYAEGKDYIPEDKDIAFKKAQ